MDPSPPADSTTPGDPSNDVLYEIQRGVAVLTLNRPEKLNATTDGMKQRLTHLTRQIADDDEVKAIVITGAGRGFCSGADLSGGGIRPLDAPQNGSRREWLQDRWAWIAGLRALEKPVIAAINGVVAGAGLGLALACDLRFASDRAMFHPVFIKRSVVPDAGVSYLLPRLVGPGRALDILWSGESFGAGRAHELGIVERVVQHDTLMTAVMDYAEQLAAGPSVTIELTKRLIYRGLEAPSLGEHAAFEQSVWVYSHATDDYMEGRRAFKENREPRYTGR